MSGAKTEEPTATRVRQARAEGDSGASLFASQAVALVAAVAILPATVAMVVMQVEERVRAALHRAAAPDPAATATFDLGGVGKDVALLSLPVLVAIAVASTAIALVQTGGVVAARGLAPNGGRSRPLAGRFTLVSRARTFAVARAVGGGTLVVWLVLRELRAHAPDIARTSGRLVYAGPAAARIVGTIGWEVALAGLGLAVVDVVVTHILWRQRLRMSKDEVRRERRESEGDPLVKGERARAQEEVIARGVTDDVTRGTIVIWDGSRVACALRYEDGDVAPRVLVTGEDGAAQRIVRRALESDVAVREHAPVVRALAAVRAGEPIPESLYDAVAELLRDLA